MRGPRHRIDAALCWTVRASARALSLFPSSVALLLLRSAGAAAATCSWPVNATRRRARGYGVRPWAWGAALAGNVASLVGVRLPLRVQGWPSELEGRGVLVLAAHLGAWEEGAAELARRGVRPLVLAAPWPRLPRAEALVAELRAARGVLTRPRSPSGLREATAHLRAGGWVVVLVDSANPERAGRRPLAFADTPIAAPDGLVSWAARQGAALVLAVGDTRSVTLQVLDASATPRRPPLSYTRATADTIVARLRDALERRPASWAWVRPLAVVALMLSLGCAASEPLPPLPLEPDRWRADVTQLAWSGPLGSEGLHAEVLAATARVRIVGDDLVGAFESVVVSLQDGDGADRGSLTAASAVGSLPGGPLALRSVRWTVDGLDGTLPEVVWSASGWTCGGCALERVARRLGPR